MSEKEGIFDFTAEPKKNFTNFLLWQIKQIFPIIYSSRSGSNLKKPVLSVIHCFDQKTKDSVFKKDIEALSNDKPMSIDDLRNLCSRIMSYVHESYLKDVNAYSGIDPNSEAEKL